MTKISKIDLTKGTLDKLKDIMGNVWEIDLYQDGDKIIGKSETKNGTPTGVEMELVDGNLISTYTWGNNKYTVVHVPAEGEKNYC